MCTHTHIKDLRVKIHMAQYMSRTYIYSPNYLESGQERMGKENVEFQFECLT